MFRPFTLAIFRLKNEKNLVSSYTRLVWVVYSGEVRGEVGARSRMCCVGCVVYCHLFRRRLRHPQRALQEDLKLTIA